MKRASMMPLKVLYPYTGLHFAACHKFFGKEPGSLISFFSQGGGGGSSTAEAFFLFLSIFWGLQAPKTLNKISKTSLYTKPLV